MGIAKSKIKSDLIGFNKKQLTLNSSKQASSTRSKSSGSSSMEELLKKQQGKIRGLHKGDAIKGRITKLTPSEILIDINAKTDAVVLEKDKRNLRNLLSLLSVGDEVLASVLNPESDMGYPVVSLRRFLADTTWKKLDELKKSQEQFDVVVDNITRGGYLVSTKEGISGFLPNSQSLLTSQNPLGSTISAFILEVDRLTQKVIFSQKPAVSSEEFEKAVKKLKPGQKIQAAISTIAPFGIFVSFPSADGKSLDGLVHISEISWDKVENIAGLFNVSDNIETVIIGIDRQAKRLELSIKRLTESPFEQKLKEIKTEEKLSGKVARVLSSGVIIEFDSALGLGGVEGFIRREKIPPNVKFEVGDRVVATVSEVNVKRQRIVLVPVLKEKPIGYR
ncbi:MAG: 30S ribosomal protein S1 [Candidatus Levybacteria bacterium]|nr:30S ribosomal protein S1 [Candidatus Levybacteria bacterium]